jgi:hypothetical protein
MPAIAKPLATGNALPAHLAGDVFRVGLLAVWVNETTFGLRELRSNVDDASHDTVSRDDEAHRWASRRISSRIAELNAAG